MLLETFIPDPAHLETTGAEPRKWCDNPLPPPPQQNLGDRGQQIAAWQQLVLKQLACADHDNMSVMQLMQQTQH